MRDSEKGSKSGMCQNVVGQALLLKQTLLGCVRTLACWHAILALRWKSNTEYIVKKAAKRLYFLKILKGYNAPREDLKTFYVSVIRSVVEYGAQI